MANRAYSYQYETSPRKLKPEYDKPRNKKSHPKNNSKPKNSKNKSKNKKQKQKSAKEKQLEIKRQKAIKFRTKFSIFVKSVLLFVILFFTLFRNSQITESFAKIQNLKAEMTKIQKENDQLEISIQNSINLNHVEQKAKELLGMQKLTSKQIVYISLPKKDYVEHRTEEVIITEEKNIIDKVIDIIKNLF